MQKLGLTGLVILLANLAFSLTGCESEPCVGDRCPDACNGASCGAALSSSSAGGRYTSCSSNAACDTASGFQCVEGTCRYACQSHFDCTGVGLCTAFPSAGAAFCAASEQPQPVGQYYTRCPDTTECDEEAGFECQGAGVGDLDSYCTARCASDVDCPTGFLCDRVGVTPCGSACGVQGDPQDPECVPTSSFDQGGEYQCGLTGPEHAICVKRRFCAGCETDADCGTVPGLICARDESGAKICTQPCDPAVGGCPWGNAAQCGFWDSERGIATCSHLFGACHGTGQACEPCFTDDDCGSTGICTGSSFTGERYCLDLSISCSCEGSTVSGGTCSGGGCPDTPGGLPMRCWAERGICLGANANPNPLLASPQTSCWPAF